jgi:hypothetical protein
MGRELQNAKGGKGGGKADRTRSIPAQNTAPTEKDVIYYERSQYVTENKGSRFSQCSKRTQF